MAEWDSLTTSDASNVARFPEGQNPSSVNDGMRALEAILARGLKDTVDGIITTGGTSTAFTASPNRSLTTSYYDGLEFSLKFNATCGANPTLNMGAKGAKHLAWPDGTSLTSSDVVANTFAKVKYDRTNERWIVFTPSTKTKPYTAGNGLTLSDTQFLVTLGKGMTFTGSDIQAKIGDGLTFSGSFLDSVALAAATQAEMEAATSTTVAVTPGRTRFHPGVVKMWINFNGTGTVAVRSSYGFESIVDNGTGNYTLGYDPDLSSADVSVAGSWAQGTENPSAVPANGFYPAEYSTTAVRVLTTSQGSNAVDATYVHVQVWGDQ